jgi:DNA sulfur modification protein DndB
MSIDTRKSQLILPALRANMGVWNYYICFLRMIDAVSRISIAEDIHTSASLRDLLQRRLTDRSFQIADYLINQPQRFFNALVVGTYGGSPHWYELNLNLGETDLEDLPESTEGTIGVLVLSGTETLFAIDGQHRLVGIKEALKKNADLENEEICVIFVAGVTQQNRENDPAGFERTRRLFTTLNRYAKPVNKRDIIALDEDDIVAIVTRYLVEDSELFKGKKINIKGSKSIPKTDKKSLTTIITLYQAMEILLQTSKQEWGQLTKIRPSDDEIKKFQDRAITFWDSVVKYFEPIRRFQDSNAELNPVAEYRHNGGGHLLFRPIGLLIFVKAVRALIDKYSLGIPDAVERIARIPMELAEKPWSGLLWDATNKRMITASENQALAVKIMFFLVGGDLDLLNTTLDSVKREYAGILNINIDAINLNPILDIL